MTCPYCGESVMVAYDTSIRRWFCEVCGRLSVALVAKATRAGKAHDG
jgi:transposase-like protein